MKEATGELNMTLVTIVAIALILGFVTVFLPNIFSGVGNKWNDSVTDANNAILNQNQGQNP